jgi:uncharacterized membrane protein (UPF0127 family)
LAQLKNKLMGKDSSACKIQVEAVNRIGNNSGTMKFPALLAAILLVISGVRAAETAQPELPVTTLRIGSTEIRAEVADDDPERSSGLMFRESLAPDSGMLFVMPSIAPATFWMKNTLIPLSIAFLDENGTIMEIHEMEPKSENLTRSAFPRIAYALEMPQGWFSKKNIWPGEHIAGLPRYPRQP